MNTHARAPGASDAPLPELSLTEWAVLGILAVQPAHGFAVARELRADSPVGEVWSIQRPLIYRAMNRLESQGLIRPHATEPGAGGPQRTVYRLERRGRTALRRWLRTPVNHLRDVRTELLLKLVLGRRLGIDQRQLVLDQQATFAPYFAALAQAASGSADPVRLWRHESSQAVARLLEGLS
ncbi:MAG: PadR family transcriptional regulator [Acidimicrobiia bacterium]